MIQTYSLTGMTCSSCEAKVTSALLTVANVTNIAVSKNNNTAIITMDKPIAVSDFAKVLDPKYQITTMRTNKVKEQPNEWLNTYKPIMLIFFFIILVTGLVQYTNHHFVAMQWMQHFMAGFFLVFSFFKLLNLRGFAESYAMYDIIAKRWSIWGVIYPFVELALGISYLINYNPLVTNITTLLVMNISIIGVLQAVVYKKKIQCACLGAVFNLPMSTITIIEDALMIVMSGLMLYKLL